ncbi:type VI secretion system protein TssA [Utexia brackfieldae]|uniref:type VI secretion system protein TssA n=1 Tax=Utexia brackfieldae TaxID=3074108 RepID=UPI00370DAA47
MEFITEHPWRQVVTQRFSQELEKQPIAADNPDWLDIESEAAKIGTISHDTVDMGHIQQVVLALLQQSTKDFRLIAHLINTLQRSDAPNQILLGITLLADYIEIYWDIAAPQKLKKRILYMIIQRFSMVKSEFNTQAIDAERNESTMQFVRLKQALQASYPDICDELDKLIISYAKVPSALAKDPMSSQVAGVKHVQTKPITSTPSSESDIKPSLDISLDAGSEQAWRRTLLKVIEIENSRAPHQAIVFQLRRHIVWFNIDVPVAHNDRTQVPPLPAEKVSGYMRELNQPTVELWQKIENTLTYSPYWFDGHFMSAQIAQKLGYPHIAKLIKHALGYFLQRCPACATLHYNNGDPFASEQTLKWLNKKALISSHIDQPDQSLAIFEADGLAAAIHYLDQQSSQQLRDLSYAQLQTITLMHKVGCDKLAHLQLDQLQHKVSQLEVKHWEPAFFERCDEVAAQIGHKE